MGEKTSYESEMKLFEPVAVEGTEFPGLGSYACCPSLKTLHFHEEGFSDGSITMLIFPLVVLCGLFIIELWQCDVLHVLAVINVCMVLLHK